jgi:phage/plasmid primase-like uncharacterized protein
MRPDLARAVEQAQNADILGVAERLGTKLRKAGDERIGPCPKCGGRDRFAVNPGRRIFNCRGCQTGGDVIDLVQHARELGFLEAVAFLAGEDIRVRPAQKPTPAAKSETGPSHAPLPGRARQEKAAATADRSEDVNLAAEAAKALRIWRRREPIVEGNPAWRYLRAARGYDSQIPATLGFLPARGGYAPCMIAAFGAADEPEPGLVAIADEAVRAVHLTQLLPDGSDRTQKIIVGQGAMGAPIVLAPANDLGGLAITEGIEDALSVHAATGLGAWAAGNAGRMPALADTVPDHVECVSVFGDRDEAGERAAHELAARLVDQGIETLLKFLETEHAP